MDLIELRRAIRRGWPLGLVAAMFVTGLGLLVVGPAEDRYASSSTILVTPRAERFESVSTGVLRVVLPNVVVVARSRSLHDEVAPTVDAAADIATDATFVHDSGVLTLTARSRSRAAAIEWSNALAEALVERYEDDPYLRVEVLDPAQSAARPSPVDRAVDVAGIALLAIAAAVLTVFGLQRIRESGDVVARVRRGGIPVLAELVVPGRGPRPSFRGDREVGKLALSLATARDVAEGDRFVVVSDGTRSGVVVVDAVRAGLRDVGLQRTHRVALGPDLDDLPALHRESGPGSQCVVVLDSQQRIDRFLDDVQTVIATGVPVIGAVVVRRRALARRGSGDAPRGRRRRRGTRGRRRRPRSRTRTT